MSNEDITLCAACRKYLKAPIRQCEKTTHNYCEVCVEDIRECIKCGSDILCERNTTLEKLLMQAKYPCKYESNGCKYVIGFDIKYEHEQDCQFRQFTCEGKRFCKWNCPWKGNYSEIEQHFKTQHAKYANLSFKNECMRIPFNITQPYKELQLISAHYQLFWFKQRVDLDKKRLNWTVEFIGPKQKACFYYYELELFNTTEPIRKYKITEYCESDAKDTNAVYKSGKCVSIPFDTLESFKDDTNHIYYRYWIHKLQKPSNAKSESSPTLESATNTNVVQPAPEKDNLNNATKQITKHYHKKISNVDNGNRRYVNNQNKFHPPGRPQNAPHPWINHNCKDSGYNNFPGNFRPNFNMPPMTMPPMNLPQVNQRYGRANSPDSNRSSSRSRTPSKPRHSK